MPVVQAVLFLVSILLLALAAVGVTARVSLPLLAAACALLAYSLPAIQAGLR